MLAARNAEPQALRADLFVDQVSVARSYWQWEEGLSGTDSLTNIVECPHKVKMLYCLHFWQGNGRLCDCILV